MSETPVSAELLRELIAEIRADREETRVRTTRLERVLFGDEVQQAKGLCDVVRLQKEETEHHREGNRREFKAVWAVFGLVIGILLSFVTGVFQYGLP